MLATLLSERGEPVPTLIATIAKAGEELQEHIPQGDTKGEETPQAAAVPSQEVCKPIWKVTEELFRTIPEEDLALLPADSAAQHDHYIYSTPKRPAGRGAS